MPERNEELFFKIADAIDDEPERYEQSNWGIGGEFNYDKNVVIHICENEYCIAGWAVELGTEKGLQFICDTVNTGRTVEDLRNPQNIVPTLGQRLLGLTSSEAGQLFSGSWEPHPGLSVGDTLRKIGGGAEITIYDDNYDEEYEEDM